ncbi:MAG TPA: anti-sigma factor [Terriglobales bacterium]|nr:anti-sigma factor [Terriglobales bacterium]
MSPLLPECAVVQPALSAYLDGELEPNAGGALIHHLESCAGCAARLHEYRALGQHMRALESMTLPEPPLQMALRLRVAASHYSVRHQRWNYWRLRWASAIRALALPTAVGTLAALVLFTALAGGVRTQQVSPMLPDVPLGLATPPRLSSGGLYNIGPVVIDAQIDAQGRVYGYRVVSGSTDPDIIQRLNNQLLLSVFRPARTMFGQPTTGSVLVSFGTVDVRG